MLCLAWTCSGATCATTRLFVVKACTEFVDSLGYASTVSCGWRARHARNDDIPWREVDEKRLAPSGGPHLTTTQSRIQWSCRGHFSQNSWLVPQSRDIELKSPPAQIISTESSLAAWLIRHADLVTHVFCCWTSLAHSCGSTETPFWSLAKVCKFAAQTPRRESLPNGALLQCGSAATLKQSNTCVPLTQESYLLGASWMTTGTETRSCFQYPGVTRSVCEEATDDHRSTVTTSTPRNRPAIICGTCPWKRPCSHSDHACAVERVFVRSHQQNLAGQARTGREGRMSHRNAWFQYLGSNRFV